MTTNHGVSNPAAGRPPPASLAIASRMSKQVSRDTMPELAVRRLLFSTGLRYRIGYPVPGHSRRTIDVAFPRKQVAIFIDGCFWHGCSTHKSIPANNAQWWRDKLAANRVRDVETTRWLAEDGWLVLRFWEHESPAVISATIARAVSGRLDRGRSIE